MTTPIKISYGFKSDVGKVRDTNEDSCAVLNRTQLNGKLDSLLIVADGLGGRRAGEVASSLLVETVSFGVLEMTSMRDQPFELADVEQLLRDTIVRANGKIMTHGRFNRREETRGMATTCVAAILYGGFLIVGNVGDSRLYLCRGGALIQLTEDHSEVFEELIKGNLTEEEARNHKFRNQITRAVGLDPNVRPDITAHKLESGDTVLLCSDGLTTELPDEVIETALSASPDPQSACDLLVAHALHAGGRDNVTVVVMHYGEFTAEPGYDELLDEATEPDTDPTQDWKTGAQPASEDDWDTDSPSRRPEIHPAEPTNVLRSPPPKVGFQALLLQYGAAVIAVLFLAVLVEAAMMVNLHRKAGAEKDTVPPPVTISEMPNPGTLTYEPARLVIDTAILPDYLQLSSQGNPVVARPDGVIVKVLPTKNMIAMGPQFPTVPVIKPSTTIHSTHPSKSRADLYCDASGNIYYLNPTTKCVETYTKDGTRTNQDLGKGQLVAPTRIIADKHGDIYVIDDGHLKILSVKTPAKGQAHPSNADY